MLLNGKEVKSRLELEQIVYDEIMRRIANGEPMPRYVEPLTDRSIRVSVRHSANRIARSMGWELIF